MIGRAAGDNIDLLDLLHFLIGEIHAVKMHLTVCHDGIDRIADDLRLLVDLLEHEMLIAALFGGFRIPLDLGQLLLQHLAVDVVEGHIALFELRDLHIADVIDIAGVFQDRRNIRGDIALAVRDADDHRAVLAGAVDLARIVLEHDAERIGAADADHCAGDRFDRQLRILLVVVVDHLDRDLGIGLGVERIALLDELFALLLIILDDAVMDGDDIAVVARMRMRIDSRGFAVRCPAGMADAAGTLDRLAVIGHFRKHLELALFLDDLGLIFSVADGDARRIISAVLQLGESVKQHRCCLIASDISYDSTHKFFLSFFSVIHWIGVQL